VPEAAFPRVVDGSWLTSIHWARGTGLMIICAMRIARVTTNGSRPRLISGTITWPR